MYTMVVMYYHCYLLAILPSIHSLQKLALCLAVAQKYTKQQQRRRNYLPFYMCPPRIYFYALLCYISIDIGLHELN